MGEPIIGLDLGTTNSEVAVVENGQVMVIAEDGRKILPSVVGLADDGAILVGEAARNQYALYPERTVRSVKRLMGQDEQVLLGDKAYSPQEISAIILKRLKGIAERHLGRQVNKAVITVPAYFSDTQRQATREAGEIAGLEVVRMINEPTAAMLAYEAIEKRHKRVLVYDLGGGTFDVSVVALQNDVVEVLASHGNNHLGGDDFDRKIIDLLVDHLQEKSVGVMEDKRAMARLTRAAESAKMGLSDHPFVLIEEEYLFTRKGQPVHLSYELSRENYEALIEPYVEETLQAVHTALTGAELSASDIDEVLLVGGATRTPLIRQRLQQIFTQSPRGEIDPDLCVATGAAIQAAAITGEVVSAVLVDITPYTFGTSVIGDLLGESYPFVYVPVIEKNTALPVSKSDVFYTSYDGQTEIRVTIYQGEEEDALDNILIGEFMVEGLSNVPEGNPVILSLDLDIDGILRVTAEEKGTGLQKSITIDNAMSKRLDEEGIDSARTRIATLFDDDPDDDSDFNDDPSENNTGRQLVTQAQALVEKAERLMDDAGPEDREDLVDQVEIINDTIVADDHSALREAVDNLSDLIYYLET